MKPIVYDGVGTIPQEISKKLRDGVRNRSPIDMFEYKKKKLQEIIDKANDNNAVPFTITTKNL